MKKIYIFLSLLFIFYAFLSCSKSAPSESKPEPTQPPNSLLTLTETGTTTATLQYTYTPTETFTYTSTPTKTSTFTATQTFTNTSTITSTLTSTSTATFTFTSTPITVEIKCTGVPSFCTDIYDTVIIQNTINNYGQMQSNSMGYDGFNKRRVLIKFNLNSLPSTATVIEARLIFYVNNFSEAVSNPFLVAVYKINSDWGELTETWATHNGGDFDSNFMALSNVIGIGLWTIFLDPVIVTGWVNGSIPNYGVLLKQYQENTSKDLIDISMKENINEVERPHLIIKYIN